MIDRHKNQVPLDLTYSVHLNIVSQWHIFHEIFEMPVHFAYTCRSVIQQRKKKKKMKSIVIMVAWYWFLRIVNNKTVFFFCHHTQSKSINNSVYIGKNRIEFQRIQWQRKNKCNGDFFAQIIQLKCPFKPEPFEAHICLPSFSLNSLGASCHDSCKNIDCFDGRKMTTLNAYYNWNLKGISFIDKSCKRQTIRFFSLSFCCYFRSIRCWFA